MTSPSRPVRPGERIVVLDALRGFALLGILMINMRLFSGWLYMPAGLRAELATTLDGTVHFVHDWLVLHKFYSLFSLLFGIGFAIQAHRARERGTSLAPLYARRMVLLFLFGLAHLLLLYEWDILHLYAACGLPLLLFRRRSDGALLAWAVVLIGVLPVAERIAIVLSDGGLDPQVALVAWGERVLEGWGLGGGRATWLVQSRGGWDDLVRYNLANWVYRTGDILERGFAFQVLGTFLVGLWTGRRLMAGRLLEDRRLLRRVALWGLAIGLPVNWAFASRLDAGVPAYSTGEIGVEILRAVGVTPLALAYAAGFALLWRYRPWRALLGTMAPAGRAALTNYVGQSVLAILLFYAVGLGLAGTMGPARWTLATLAVFVVQAGLSALWLARLRYGPLEWMWRRLTYLRALGGRP